MSAREFAILERQWPEAFKDGKWTHRTLIDTVRVLARAEGYAMVRLKGAMPFVVSEKRLRKATEQGEAK